MVFHLHLPLLGFTFLMQTLALAMTAGDSVTLAIPMEWDGAAFTPGTDYSFLFTCKRNPNDRDYKAVIQKATGLGIITAGSVASVSLVPDDSEGLGGCQLYFDLQAQHNTTGALHTVALGKLSLRPGVTQEVVSSITIYTTEPPSSVSLSTTDARYVRFDAEQTLTSAQKLQARVNMGSLSRLVNSYALADEEAYVVSWLADGRLFTVEDVTASMNLPLAEDVIGLRIGLQTVGAGVLTFTGDGTVLNNGTQTPITGCAVTDGISILEATPNGWRYSAEVGATTSDGSESPGIPLGTDEDGGLTLADLTVLFNVLTPVVQFPSTGSGFYSTIQSSSGLAVSKGFILPTTEGTLAITSRADGRIDFGDLVNTKLAATKVVTNAAARLALTAANAQGFVVIDEDTNNSWLLIPSGDPADADDWKLIGRKTPVVVTELTADFSTAATIPYDATIPQSGEGTEYITASITPQNAASMLEVEVHLSVGGSGGGIFIGALFRDSAADALEASGLVVYGNSICQASFRTRVQAGSTAATTFKLRVGSNGITVYINRISGTANLFGDVLKSRMIVREILP